MGPYFFLVVVIGGFYVLQLFTSVMIITLSHCNRQMEEQEEDARERDELGLPPASSSFDLQEDKVGDFVNWVSAGLRRCVACARTATEATEEDEEVVGAGGVKRHTLVKREVLPAAALALSRRLQTMVEHAAFRRCILGVICLNTLTMVGRCRLKLSTPVLKAPAISALEATT